MENTTLELGMDSNPPPVNHPFKFDGQGREYFRIWIVNISLTILTLGIYSAWAKVRNLNYFYGNTQVAGSSFEYHANPVSIFKGRLMVFGFFILYLVLTNYYPATGLVFSLLFLILTPTLIVRSLKFTAQNSSYRGVRFDFNGSIGGAVKNFILWPILAMFSFGLLFPYMLHQQHKYVVGNAAFGTQKFKFNSNVKGFYGICLKASALSIVLMVIIMLMMSNSFELLLATSDETGEPEMQGGFFIMAAFMMAFGSMMQGYFHALLMNARYKQTQLGDTGRGESGFVSNLGALDLAWVYLTNLVLIVCSLGLAIPFTKIRLMRYRTSCLKLKKGSSFDYILSIQLANQSALGEEAGEAMDLDFAL